MLFVAKDLKASRVNLMMNNFVAGLPSPLSFIGLGDVIARNLGDETPSWSVRVLPILHEVDVSIGRLKPEMQRTGSFFKPIETFESMHGTVCVSVIFDIPGCEDELAVSEILNGKRISGGPIWNKEVVVAKVLPDGSSFSELNRGYAIVAPTKPEMCVTSHGDYASLTRLAETLYQREGGKGSGWIIPSAVGYRLIEDPKTAPTRSGVRDQDIPHVFAEPLTGIAELVSIRNPRLRDATTDEFSKMLWSWHSINNEILGHRAYIQDPSNESTPNV